MLDILITHNALKSSSEKILFNVLDSTKFVPKSGKLHYKCTSRKTCLFGFFCENWRSLEDVVMHLLVNMALIICFQAVSCFISLLRAVT